MHKWMVLQRIVLAALLLFFIRPYSMPAETADAESVEWKDLTGALHLTGPQAATADQIWKGIQAQAVKDREQNIDNPEALIQQVRLRQQTADERLESVLTPEQLTGYRKLKIQRDRNWEYLYLREGLDLTNQQGPVVKAIVDEYRSQWESTIPGGGGSSGGRNELKDGKSRRGGGLDVEMGKPGNMYGSGAYPGKGSTDGKAGQMTQMELEENRRIFEVLTETQRGWAGRVFQMIKTERDSRLKRFMIVN